MKKNSLIINPPFIFACIWLFIYLIYSFNWSYLYPILSLELKIFILSTIIISLILGLITWKTHLFSFYIPQDTVKYRNKCILFAKILLLLFIIDILYSRSIPLFNYITSGTNARAYQEFGAPFIHIIVVNGFIVLFNFSFLCYKCSDNDKKTYRNICLLCFLQPVLCYSRAQMLFMVIGIILTTIILSKNFKKTCINTFLMSIIILYIFGLLGDLRHKNAGENYFIKLAGATDKFENSKIPSTFFWGYIYFSSPLANLQNIIKYREKYLPPDKEGIEVLFYHELLPGIIKRRIKLDNTIPVKSDPYYLIIEQLNVGGLYYGAYAAYKWKGMIIIFLFYLFSTYIFTKLIRESSILKIPLIISLSNITIMSTFNNPFTGDGFMPQLFIILITYKIFKI